MARKGEFTNIDWINKKLQAQTIATSYLFNQINDNPESCQQMTHRSLNLKHNNQQKINSVERYKQKNIEKRSQRLLLKQLPIDNKDEGKIKIKIKQNQQSNKGINKIFWKNHSNSKTNNKQNIKNNESFNSSITLICKQKIRKFFQRQRIYSQSSSTIIFQKINNFLQQQNIQLSLPLIKKYKNSVYYGEPIQKKTIYKGLLLTYHKSIYYGSFLNGLKNGKGIQLSIETNSIIEGDFLDGHITGHFKVITDSQKYQGQMMKGLYHGSGKLTTQLSTYKGQFKQGLRHGLGQQMFQQSKLILKGYFTEGVLEMKHSCSIKSQEKRDKQIIKEKLQEQKEKQIIKGRQKFKLYEQYDYSFQSCSFEDKHPRSNKYSNSYNLTKNHQKSNNK